MAEKSMQMGLGEAIQQLIKVETIRSRGIAAVPEEAKAERDMIVQALNTHMLDLGFDCNVEETNIPANVQIFAKSAQTSCCRLKPNTSSRRK